ncbi:MAG TPA: sulfatase-like hydrolase/transferase [Terriglobia bacterium]|nr:sulfatase-like hydrolase/transferase [Terriglobia bacterium]
MLTRRKFLQVGSTLAATKWSEDRPAQAGGQNLSRKDHPNFLVFMPDQHQGEAVLPHYPTIMPNVRRFASQGITFTQAFCPAPHCCPSRASFMTGLYPSEHGIFNNVNTDTAIHANPYPGIPFFSRTLREAGYELAYSGKWHVARDRFPQDYGWKNLNPSQKDYEAGTYVPGRLRRPSAWEKARSELNRTRPRDPGEVLRPGWGNIRLYSSFPPLGPRGYEGTKDHEAVRRGIEGLAALAGSGKPWCLMISNLGGHDLYRAPQNFVDMYHVPSIPLPISFRDALEDKPRIYQRMRYQYWRQLSDQEVQRAILHYWAKLTMQDALFGLLLDALEKTGQAENTIVIYTADHGDYAGAHGLWAKGVPSFREAYNIPCVIRWPRGITHPGRAIDALVSTVDFAPTILDAAAIQPVPQMSGLSLLPWLRGETPANWRRAVFTQLNGVELYYTQRIVMTGSYKYVYNGFDYDELYDLKEDPHEMVNLAFPELKQARAVMAEGTGLRPPESVPWPHLPSNLAEVRRDLLQQMWEFAQERQDQIFDPYLTVAMAPMGPGIEL